MPMTMTGHRAKVVEHGWLVNEWIHGLYCCHTHINLKKRTICAFLSEIQISDSVSMQFQDEQVKFGICYLRHWPIIWIFPPTTSSHHSIRCLHPPGTAILSWRSAIVLSKAPCRSTTRGFLLLAVKTSTQRPVPAEEDRRVHGFHSFFN